MKTIRLIFIALALVGMSAFYSCGQASQEGEGNQEAVEETEQGSQEKTQEMIEEAEEMEQDTSAEEE